MPSKRVPLWNEKETHWQSVKGGVRVLASYGPVVVAMIRPLPDGRIEVIPVLGDNWKQSASQTITVLTPRRGS